VSCFPDITVHQRTPEDEALILACDGVWDVISNDEACQIVREIFADGGTVLDLVAEELIDTALQKGNYHVSIVYRRIWHCHIY
jgi:serine/threonine protein phosphatase PrpC